MREMGGWRRCIPLGPSTVTSRERMWTLTPSGMTSCSWEKMYFIVSSGLRGLARYSRCRMSSLKGAGDRELAMEMPSVRF